MIFASKVRKSELLKTCSRSSGPINSFTCAGGEKKGTQHESLSVFLHCCFGVVGRHRASVLPSLNAARSSLLSLSLAHRSYVYRIWKKKRRKLLFPLALTSNTDIFSTTFAFLPRKQVRLLEKLVLFLDALSCEFYSYFFSNIYY